MNEPSMHRTGRKKDWILTPQAFQRLLTWLDEDADSGGQKYLEMRRRLVAYFDRKNCLTPDELADEVLTRVARRLEEEGAIESEAPAHYCYIVARFVFMEYLREARKADAWLDHARRQAPAHCPAASEADDEKRLKEKMLNCLEQCAGKLPPPNRETILRYYAGKERVRIENRRALAAELGISINALSIRACRIRDQLEDCVRRCVGAQ